MCYLFNSKAGFLILLPISLLPIVFFYYWSSISEKTASPDLSQTNVLPSSEVTSPSLKSLLTSETTTAMTYQRVKSDSKKSDRMRSKVVAKLPPDSLIESSTAHSYVIPKITSPQRRARAAIVVLAQNSDVNKLHGTLGTLEMTFNRRYNYPYVFLNDEPFDDNFIKTMNDLLVWQYGSNETNPSTTRKVSFGLIPKEHWSHPEWIDKKKAEDCRHGMVHNRVKYAEKPSYFHMCRFYAGFFYRHPLLLEYDYYWRIEPGTKFGCILDYDPFVFMMDRGIEYGYSLMMPESMNTVPTLWNTTKKFLRDIYPTLNIIGTPLLKLFLRKEKGFKTAKESGLNDKAITANAGLLQSIEGYTWDVPACHFWNNFEIASLNFFRSRPYQAYFDYLDKAGGFFYERWGDAPVHTLAVGMFLNVSQIHHFDDIGYYHGESWCPNGKDFASKCFCDPVGWGNMAAGLSRYWHCIRDFLKDIKKLRGQN